MASSQATSERERRFAYQFLRYLGANLTNQYLYYAVIAWMRKESGTTYIGNNPFNLRPGKDDAKYRSGVRKSKRKNGGYFSVYPSLTAAARATAQRLIRAGSDYRKYNSIVNIARRQTKDEEGQAWDFLAALALSKWSSDHYGTGKAVTVKTYDKAKNALVPIWAGLVNYAAKHRLKNLVPLDAAKPWDAPAKKPAKPKPAPPKANDRLPSQARPNFLEPYDAYGFYEARRRPTPVLE